MITLDDYWMGRDKLYPLDMTETIRANAQRTVEVANRILTLFKAETKDTEQRKVTSGWRPPRVNAAIPNAATKSLHMTGEAIDIADPDGMLDEWLDEAECREFKVYKEHPASTKGWCHIQIKPPKSGNRIFYP